MNSKTKGYALGIIAAATYGMNPLFALPLYADGMDTNSVLFFRYLFAIIIVGIMTHMRGHSLKLTRREFLPVAAMGILAALSSLTLFMSYHYMAAGIASTILFVYPILVALIMTFFFGEKLTLQTILCITLALFGIGLLYTARFWEYKTMHNITGSVNFHPTRWFTLTGSYSVLDNRGSAVGLGLNLCPGWINFFLATDLLLTKHTPQWVPVKQSSMNLTLGIGIPLGKRSHRIAAYVRENDRK